MKNLFVEALAPARFVVRGSCVVTPEMPQNPSPEDTQLSSGTQLPKVEPSSRADNLQKFREKLTPYDVALKRGDLHEAHSTLLSAWEFAKACECLQPAQAARVLFNLGALEAQLGDDRAEWSLLQGLALQCSYTVKLDGVRNLATYYKHQGRDDLFLGLVRDQISKAEELGVKGLALGSLHFALGLFLEEQGEYKNSLRQLNRARVLIEPEARAEISLLEKAPPGPETPAATLDQYKAGSSRPQNIKYSRNAQEDLGRLLPQLGRIQSCLALHEQAEATLRDAIELNGRLESNELLPSLEILGKLQLRLNRFEQAGQTFSSLVTVIEGRGSRENPQLIVPLGLEAVALANPMFCDQSREIAWRSREIEIQQDPEADSQVEAIFYEWARHYDTANEPRFKENVVALIKCLAA